MRKIWLLFLVISLSGLGSFAMAATEPFEDYLPVQTGMKITMNDLVEHMEQKERPWKITVNKSSFPSSITYSWVHPQKDEPESTGTRILTDLTYSRNFNPWYRKNESKATSDTAPWVSIQILKELRESNKAANFREGGTGAINWAATSLTIKEKMIFPVMINGKAQALHAFRLNKGLVIWNNLKNPLVLQYEPLGVPLFTSISGWKVTDINY